MEFLAVGVSAVGGWGGDVELVADEEGAVGVGGREEEREGEAMRRCEI